MHYAAAHYYNPDKAQFQDFEPFWEFVSGPLHAGTFGPNALDNTFGPEVRFVKAPGKGNQNLPPSAGMQFFGHVKIDGASSWPNVVGAIVRAGIPVWAQFGIEPHTADGGLKTSAPAVDAAASDQRVREATLLEDAGASLLDFTNSGPVAGPEVVRAVSIPVLGGLGGGPWLDGRIRSVVAAIGYAASAIDDATPRYANVAETTLHAIEAFCDDVRTARQIRGGAPATRAQ